MIAIESFKRFRMKDIGAILIFALWWTGFSYSIDALLGPQASYIQSLLLAMLFMSLTVHVVRKAGAATLFFGMGALFTWGVADIGPTGMNKLMTLVIAGLIFELIFVILKLEVKNVKLDILIGTALSSASIPVITAFLLSKEVATKMSTALINLSLLSFFVGIVSAVVSFLLWYHFRTKKCVLRFEYGL